MGEGIACGGLLFPDSDFPVPDGGANYWHLPGIILLWDLPC